MQCSLFWTCHGYANTEISKEYRGKTNRQLLNHLYPSTMHQLHYLSRPHTKSHLPKWPVRARLAWRVSSFMRADFVLFQTEFCWKFSNNNLNHRHKHQFPDDYRERRRHCLLEQKQSETERIYGVTSAGHKNLLLKSEATLPVVATRLVYLAAVQTTYTWLQSLCCEKPGFLQHMRDIDFREIKTQSSGSPQL